MLSERHEIRVERWLGAPRELVFDALTDPEQIRALPGIRSLTVLEEDDDPDDTGGRGHRREVVLGPGRFVEQITGWDPPRRFDYRILEASVPIEHEAGWVELREHNGGTAIEWVSVFRVRAPLFADLIARWADQQMEHLLDRHVGFLAGRLRAERVLPRPDVTRSRPERVQRFLDRHAGGRDAERAEVELHGRIKLGDRWLDFTSILRIEALSGFRWEARVHQGALRFSGHDVYANGKGEMLWRAYGLIPVVRADSADVTHSARGRAAMEQLFMPWVLGRPEVDWSETADGWARARWVLDGHEVGFDLDLEDGGRVRAIRLERWSDAEGEPWREVIFGADVRSETVIDGVTLPGEVVAGWFFGEERWEEGRFFEARVVGLRFPETQPPVDARAVHFQG